MIPPESIRVSHLTHTGNDIFTAEWCSVSHPDSALITHQAESYSRPHSHDHKPWAFRAILHDRRGPDTNPMIIDVVTIGDEHSGLLYTAPDYTRDPAGGPRITVPVTDTDPFFTTCRRPKIFHDDKLVTYHRCEVHRHCDCNGYHHTRTDGTPHSAGMVESFTALPPPDRA